MPSWRQDPLPHTTVAAGAHHWLVLTDEVGVAEAIATALRADGERVTVAPLGSEEEHIGGPDAPDQIVHCGGVTATPAGDRAHELGFASLLHLGGMLSRVGDGRPRTLWVLTTGLHDVTGEEALEPLKATVLGPCRVLPREVAGLRCRNIDIECRSAPTTEQLALLLVELRTPVAASDAELVAHRGRHRWTRHYVAQQLAPADGTVHVIESGAPYLVTGGLGGLGLALAEHLTLRGARVVLTARRPLSAAPAEVRSRVDVLRAAGADLLVLIADVSDEKAMTEVVAKSNAEWGPLRGAFHLAGVAGGGIVQLKDLATAEEVLRPKVTGTLVLERCLDGQPLDFLVLFGSNGANVGSLGQVDYCAANCFLDAFARDRGRRRRVLTIDWGAWSEVGMSVSTALPAGFAEMRRQATVRGGMSTDEGLRALDTALARITEPQVIITPMQLEDVFAAARSTEWTAGAPVDEPTEPPDSGDAVSTVDTIVAVWREQLGVEHVGVDESFFDLGGNSLVGIQVVDALNRRLTTRVAVADLYEQQTVANLAALVEGSAPVVAEGAAAGAAARRQRLQQRRAQQRRRAQGR